MPSVVASPSRAPRESTTTLARRTRDAHGATARLALDEKHVTVDKATDLGSAFDFGLFFFHNAPR